MPQDFSYQNLRGRSFKGQDLTEANFSHTDIQSTDFTGANLRGANFSHAIAGVQNRWAIFLICVSWLLAGISGLLSTLTESLITYIFHSSSLENLIAIWTAFIVVIIIFIVILEQGLNSNIAFLVAGIFVIPLAAAGVVGFLVAGTIAGALTGAVIYALALAFLVTGALAGAFAFLVAGGIFDLVGSVVFALAGALAGAFVGSVVFAINFMGSNGLIILFAVFFAFAFAVPFALAGVLFSAYYIGWRSMKKDEYSLIRNMAIAFAAFGGTSFRKADLTDANFTAATLKSTDFRKAILTRTSFKNTRKLDYSIF